MPFVIASAAISAIAMLMPKKIRALPVVVALRNIGVDTDFLFADLTSTLKQLVNFIIRNKAAFYGFKALHGMKIRDRFIQIRNLGIEVHRRNTLPET